MTDRKKRDAASSKVGAPGAKRSGSNLSGSGNTVLSAATEYLQRGWAVVPINAGSKRPVGKNWQNLRLTEGDLPQHFSNGENVGVLLGNPSNGLIDIDLDATEAAYLAPRFLPSTGAVFGRASKEESHWLYTVRDMPSTVQHETPAPEGAMLVELRSTGGQTVFPPSVHPSGEQIEWTSRGDPDEVDASELIQRVGQLAAASLLARAWPERGARNKVALALAGGLLRSGWDTERVKDLIVAVAEAAGDEEAEDRTLSIASTKSKIDSGQEATGWPALGELLGKLVVERVTRWLGIDKKTASDLSFNDQGNAQRLANLFGEDLRWSPKLDWLAWDGRRWQQDADAIARQHALKIPAEVAREGAAKSDPAVQGKYFSWATASGNAGHIEGSVRLARYQERILIRTEQSFDRQPLLLNCLNGTLDLKNDVLLPHRREDLLTKVVPENYDPTARSATWERFLRETTGNSSEMVEFLQQFAGYCLTGLTDEEKLVFVHGPSGTGKSTFAEALKAMLGDYAATADFETFLAKKGDSGARTDLARLAGKRYVLSIEVDQGRRLAEGVVKTITGGDEIAARKLYKEHFEYKPEYKLVLVANQRPLVWHFDSAMARRILEVPFDRVVPKEKRDPEVKKELTDPQQSGAAILAWAVEGYKKWRQHGSRLVIPQEVVEASAEYQHEMDPLRDFLSDRCNVGVNLRVRKKLLRENYVEHCKSSGNPILPESAFKQHLLEHRIVSRPISGVWHWIGVEVRLLGEIDSERQQSSATAEKAY